MTSKFRACARLLALALPLLAIPAWADGRADWPDYWWQKIDIATCRPQADQLVCPPYHQKWDWKRPQWVDIAIALEPQAGRLRLTQRLTNNDPHDDDDVCVTVLLLDATGHTLLAHHQNWHSVHQTSMQDDFVLRADTLEQAVTISIGAKQCRKGPHQDDAIYAAVRAGLSL